MKRSVSIFVLVILAFGAGCSNSVWMDPGTVTPISYRPSPTRFKRTVGKLRRLAVLPVRFHYSQGMNADTADRAKQELQEARSSAESKRRILFDTVRHLSDWKGYEVVPLGMDADTRPEKSALAAGDMRKYWGALADWADSSPDGAAPPEEISRMVARIGRANNVDGLVLIQGFVKNPSALTFALVLATASVAWPLMFVEGKSALKADIYEVSTGKIVWRSRFEGSHTGIAGASALFEKLENAVPAVFIQKDPARQKKLETMKGQ